MATLKVKNSEEYLISQLKEIREQIKQYKKFEKEHKKTEKYLRQSEERFRKIIEATPLGIHMYDLQENNQLIFTGANPAADKILGTDNSQFIGKPIEKAFPPLADTEVPQRYREAAAKGKPWQTQQINYDDNKISGAFEVYAFQIRPNSMAAMFWDVTDKIRAEEALRLTQFSIDHMADAAFWMEKNAKFFYVNDAACRSLGYSRKELLKMNVHDIDPMFPLEAWGPHWKTVKKDKSFSIESMHRKKNGQVFPVELSINYVAFGGKEMNCAFARDISNRKQAEEKIKASEEKYRQLVESSNDAIYIHFKRRFELINTKFKEMLEVTEEDVNQPGFDLMDLVAPQSRHLIAERDRMVAQGKEPPPQHTFTARSASGREIEVEASVSYIKYKDGFAVQGILRDVSERKNMEEKLRQMVKMEALGTLAGGIAHNFNNILMGIQGRASLILMDIESRSSLYGHLQGIEEYVQSAADLTKQLLGFARGGKYQIDPININQLIKKAASMFAMTRKEIKIHQKYEPNIHSIEVDEGQIEQVLLNLFVNAWQAMPSGGHLYIQTQNERIDEPKSQLMNLPSGNYVKISVRDTGMGMDEMTMQKIFDPFFSTKMRGKGTGLGLATVYGIIQNHGGIINVDSQNGKGATFTIYLPGSTKTPRIKTEKKTAINKGNETLLLVDDEAIVVEVTSAMLEEFGYQVLVANSGKDAIEIYKRNQSGIDLVILDMVMPERSGGETFDLLRTINPKVKVLLSSGYSLNGEATKIIERGCNGFIQKPYHVNELSEMLRGILDEK